MPDNTALVTFSDYLAGTQYLKFIVYGGSMPADFGVSPGPGGGSCVNYSTWTGQLTGMVFTGETYSPTQGQYLAVIQCWFATTPPAVSAGTTMHVVTCPSGGGG